MLKGPAFLLQLNCFDLFLSVILSFAQNCGVDLDLGRAMLTGIGVAFIRQLTIFYWCGKFYYYVFLLAITKSVSADFEQVLHQVILKNKLLSPPLD